MSGAADPRRFFRRRWEAPQLPVAGVWAARRRLADAMRRVIERLTTSDAPEAELELAAARLEDYAERLATTRGAGATWASPRARSPTQTGRTRRPRAAATSTTAP